MIPSRRGNVTRGMKTREFAIGGESGNVVDEIPAAFIPSEDVKRVIVDHGSRISFSRMNIASRQNPFPFSFVSLISTRRE